MPFLFSLSFPQDEIRSKFRVIVFLVIVFLVIVFLVIVYCACTCLYTSISNYLSIYLNTHTHTHTHTHTYIYRCLCVFVCVCVCVFRRTRSGANFRVLALLLM
jgi:hypothetical protein